MRDESVKSGKVKGGKVGRWEGGGSREAGGDRGSVMGNWG